MLDAGDKIAIGAAVIAFIAMCVAIWQAYEGRKSRKASASQADTAKKALEETKKQSAAAGRSATAANVAIQL